MLGLTLSLINLTHETIAKELYNFIQPGSSRIYNDSLIFIRRNAIVDNLIPVPCGCEAKN